MRKENEIKQAFEEQGMIILSTGSEIYWGNELTEIKVYIRNANGTYLSLAEAADQLVMIQDQVGFCIVPLKEDGVSTPEKFQFACVSMYSIKHMERLQKKMADYTVTLNRNFWVMQGKQEAVSMRDSLQEWGQLMDRIHADIRHLCKTYQRTKWNEFKDLVHEVDTMTADLDKTEAKMFKMDWFSIEELPIKALYSV